MKTLRKSCANLTKNLSPQDASGHCAVQ